MRPVDPEELSAFLDGELAPQRAEEVRHALVEDPSLCQMYEQLRAVDAEWKGRAAAVVFQPQVSLGHGQRRYRMTMACLVVGLLFLRLVLKAVPPSFSVGLAMIVFSVLAGWGLQRLLHASEDDCRAFLRSRSSVA